MNCENCGEVAAVVIAARGTGRPYYACEGAGCTTAALRQVQVEQPGWDIDVQPLGAHAGGGS